MAETAPVAPSTPTPASTPAPNANASAPAEGKLTVPPPGAKNGIGAQAAPPAPEEAKPQPPSKKKYRGKVDGEEYEEELSDDEVSVRLQKERAWRKRQNEFTSERKKLEQFYELGKKDPFAAAKELWGVDALELAQERLASQYKTELEQRNMKPEDRLKAEYEAKVKAAEEKAAALQQKMEEQEMQELEAKALETTQAEFTQALEAEGVPKSWKALAEMAHVAKLAHGEGYRLTPAQLASEVRNRLEARDNDLYNEVVGGLKGEALLKRFKPEVVKELVKAVLEQRKAATAVAPSAPVKREAAPKPSILEDLTPGQKRKRMMGII